MPVAADGVVPIEEDVVVHPPTWRGMIRATDGRGEHIVASMGFIDWEVYSDGVPEPARVRSPIKEDCWEIAAAPGALAIPSQVLVSSGMRSMVCSTEGLGWPTEELGGLVIEARIEEGAHLVIRDAATGQELEKVEIVLVHAGTLAYRDAHYPPSEFAKAGNVISCASPYVLPRYSGVLTGWARAPGYAWKRFAIARTTKRAIVELDPGADVRVRVTGLQAPTGREAFLVHHDVGDAAIASLHPEVVAARLLVDGPEFDLQGLPLGRMCFVVTRNINAKLIGPRLGQQVVTLHAGRNSDALLNLGNENSQRTLGQIVIDVAGLAERVKEDRMARVTIELLDSSGGPSAGLLEHYLARTVANDAGSVVVQEGLPQGRYLVALLPEGVRKAVELHAGEVCTVKFPESELLDLEVAVTDADGQPQARAEVRIRPVGSRAGATWREVPDTDSGGIARFRAAPGEYTILVTGGSHPAKQETVAFSSERRRGSVSLDKGVHCYLKIEVVREGTVAVMPLHFWYGIEINPLGANSGRVINRRADVLQVGGQAPLDGTALAVTFNQPGEYELRIRDCLAVPSFGTKSVIVSEGENPVLTLQWPEG